MKLRRATADDADRLRAHWSRPEVRRFLWDDEAPSAEQVAAVLAGTELHVIEVDGELAGTCGLRAAGEAVELLYSLEPEHWGKGLATTASRRVLAAAFARGERRVLAEVDDGNDRSTAVLRRLGFEGEGRTLVLVPDRFASD